MRSGHAIQSRVSRAGMPQVALTDHGAGKPGPRPPRVVWVKTSTGWVADTVAR